MAPPSFSPDASISSHTLSAGSFQPPLMDMHSTSANSLAHLFNTPYAFLQPTPQINASFLAAAKQYLDPVAKGVSEEQVQRRELKRKRKAWERHGEDGTVLQLKKVYLEGFGVNQVFEQTRKIVDAAMKEIERALPGEMAGRETNKDNESEDEDQDEGEEEDLSEGDMSDSSLGEEGKDWEYAGEAPEDEIYEESVSNDANVTDQDEDLEIDDGGENHDKDFSTDDAGTYIPDANGLNDGFFNLQEFNKQSEILEDHDARGEPPPSDDEEINWDADPLTSGKRDDLEEDSGSEEMGPTFGNVDLNAPEGDSEDELEEVGMSGVDDMFNANNIMYKDFFAPPATKASKNRKKRGRPNPHNFPPTADPQSIDDDMQRTMSLVRRDLFEDDDVGAETDDDADRDPLDRRSTHERKQARLAEEIRRLEAQNVAKREWQLSGEVSRVDRPMNSLLEEDLEFEHAGKPVPIITAEVSEEIEALIKRRILSGTFDEILRRRPDDLATGSNTRRGRFELEDTKSSKGLAEIYELEYSRATDPNFVDERSEKLKKEHAEIEGLWKSVSRKLDSLSSWHYKPKPAAPSLEIRVDAPTIEMEDARPTAGAEAGGASTLAPQELYKPGEEKNNLEVVTKGGMPIARGEMSREQKLRRRRREKERIKKSGVQDVAKKEAIGKEKKRKENKQLLGDLKKGGVQIIGKKGQITDIEGKVAQGDAKKGAGNFKL